MPCSSTRCPGRTPSPPLLRGAVSKADTDLVSRQPTQWRGLCSHGGGGGIAPAAAVNHNSACPCTWAAPGRRCSGWNTQTFMDFRSTDTPMRTPMGGKAPALHAARSELRQYVLLSLVARKDETHPQ